SRELPGAVLAVEGGGEVVIDPKSDQGMRSLETLYWIEIVASEDLGERTEERIYVRFEHGPVPLSSLLYRKLRQTFIKHFQV
ncbi:MAG TPA: peptidase M50, partial [Gammaproteobacteria bacterium]